jgi:mono/diheme cytochrome c family protein
MKRWIRRSLWAATTLVAVVGAAIVAGDELADLKMNRRVELVSAPFVLRSGADAVERGRYLYASRGCADCHGGGGAGRVFVDDGRGLKLAGPNISPGPGSVVAAYRAVDWERALRHGVKPDGRPLMIMPSEDFNRLTDADTAAIVAYVRSLAPAAGGRAVLELPLPVRVLYGFGMMQDAAAKIDHRLPPAAPVPEGVTPEHGRYVAAMCQGCHGPQFTGGRIPGAPPDWPDAARLAPGPGSALERYPDADALLAMFRSGRRPDGGALRVMPFESLGAMSAVDVRALYLYLKTLPAPARG